MRKRNNTKTYQLSKKEWILYGTAGLFLLIGISLLFYDSLLFVLPGSSLLIVYFWQLKRSLYRKQIHRIRCQFGVFLEGFCASLQTGKSVEGAFGQAVLDMQGFCGKHRELCEELQKIVTSVELNRSLENQIQELALKWDIEEMQYFAQVLSVGKKSGGNFIGTMRYTAKILQERLEVEEEIYTEIFQKELEFYMMSIIPGAMILYFRIAMSGFLEILYGNAVGVMVMSVCLGIYLSCFLYGRRLLELDDGY